MNLNWDSARNRFVFVALAGQSVYFGYSSDDAGTSWVFGNNGQPVLGGSVTWDYPSVGVDASGRIIVGAVQFVNCTSPPPLFVQCPAGYYSAVSTDGNIFSGPYTIVSSGGATSRVVATNGLFEAFVPTLDTNSLPTYIARYESSNGINWSTDQTIGMGSFGAPNNNTPPGTSSTILFYAPYLAAQGYTNRGVPGQQCWL